METRPLCIYHGGCDDGFGAAFVVNLFFRGEVDFHYGIYQQDPPDVTGRDVILVDFSYKRPVLEHIWNTADSVLILDHHKTAAEDLGDLPSAGKDYEEWIESGEPIGVVFDLERSGATIAWDFFFRSKRRPWLLEYIEDRDLWRKYLPHNDQIIMALRSYPQDFATWDSIMKAGPDTLLAEGRAIHRYYRTIIDALKRNAVRGEIGGVEVPVVNAPYHFASELAGELAEGEPFAACYWNHAHGTTYSLRSHEDGMDVSQIAALYGGGGHRGAAGFKVAAPLPLKASGEVHV